MWHFTLEAQPTVQCYGENVSGKISDEQRKDTTNIMASAIEVMGMSLPCRSTGLELTSNDFQKVSEVLFLAYVHKDVALLSYGRSSGGSHGFALGHICPEAHGPQGMLEMCLDNQTDGQAALDDSVAVRGVCEEFRNGLCCQGGIDKNGVGNESLA
ncbi:hypothetical protein V6N11_001804 [Hibiscus sabdariffa]|uniref:Dihydroxy-acid/6-phosphogluconate dehydratase C-terminal domain-containing protein n=1 Tax=Hibiscus sabdariffa TaxID=183260 RepID=A0ABR2QTJ0_9ROSI